MARILIVDDDEGMTDLLRLHLRRDGLEIDVASDATVAIRTILKAVPDLIVLDVDMPYMGGLEVLKALKGDESTRNKPVIMLTARKDDDTFTEAKKFGADAFLTKPVQKERLLQEIAFRLAQSLASPRG